MGDVEWGIRHLSPDHVWPLCGSVQPRPTAAATPRGCLCAAGGRGGSSTVHLFDESVCEHGRGHDDIGTRHQSTQIAGLQFRI